MAARLAKLEAIVGAHSLVDTGALVETIGDRTTTASERAAFERRLAKLEKMVGKGHR